MRLRIRTGTLWQKNISHTPKAAVSRQGSTAPWPIRNMPESSTPRKNDHFMARVLRWRSKLTILHTSTATSAMAYTSTPRLYDAPKPFTNIRSTNWLIFITPGTRPYSIRATTTQLTPRAISEPTALTFLYLR